MKRLSLLSALVVALVFSLASCKNDGASSSATPAPAVTNATPAATPSAAATPAVPTGPTTSMTFAEPTHDFGQIMDGDKVEHVFTFTNSGAEPLVISNAKGSC